MEEEESARLHPKLSSPFFPFSSILLCLSSAVDPNYSVEWSYNGQMNVTFNWDDTNRKAVVCILYIT